ncbi:phage tail terminator protein [Microbacterium dauci]|uniref:Minor capsid protein n=1 Tax=Microbacterium dauci TaxID=3048008 RepID=A0ABT6ZB65_9MICO|nr:minor capsid protein [Microbacterium sp. LX3-4]MDJ1113236.1 minor capsid protein [Microbacterium sp. LX3-4]
MNDDQLTDRLCELLGLVPTFVWETDPDAVIPPGSVEIFYGAIPPEADRAIGVRVYGISSDNENTVRGRRAQLRTRGRRGSKNDADQIASTARTFLTGIVRRNGISSITDPSFSLLGDDGNGRQERTDNFTVILDNLEAFS